MSEFGDAFDRARALVKAARRLGDLEYRWNRRFRLWEPPQRDDPAVLEKAEQLTQRQHDAIRLAEDAEWERDRLWDRYSRALR